MSRRVLLFSTTTGYQLRSFDEAAGRLGVEIVFATDRCHQLDDPWRDRAIAVRFHEPLQSLAAIEAEAKRAPFSGVISVGDRPVVLAARVARLLRLLGNAPSAAAASGNKREARARFAAAGLNVPWHVSVPLADGLSDEVRAGIRYPCVLKPLGLSGSRGVIRADSPDAIDAAFARIGALLKRVDVRAARTGLEDEVLIEDFIPGREYAIEGVLTAGMLQIFTVFDKPDPLDGPFFEETIYVTPSALEPRAYVDLIRLVEEGARALGLTHGPIHAECRIGSDGAFLLEIASRPIGGLCSRALRFEGGRSLEEILLRHALGEDVSIYRREAQASAVMMIPIPKRGLLKSVEGIERARAVPHVEDVQITAKPDQFLEPLPEAGSYLGFIFARAANVADAEAAVRDAHASLTFTIDARISVMT
ncbi:MAG TPA: ATP-grasp domain-containing protein [Vicinamibacterales bacterium]|jgi:biotin carboxylase